MELGFLIDQRKCIGCHACTVACKAENEVPVGSFRTWVKYVEKGSFPAVRRHFTVLRCNHCDAAPCVEICPVRALHKRPDAVVDLDRDLCIGCRACMQACPYDAIYLNEDRGTAEKCHFCAHRVERGLEPACVVVCPETAIVAGDVADSESTLAKLLRELPTTQRKPEAGTRPRVWYADALPEALDPTATREPDAWLWSDRQRVPARVPGELDVERPVTTWNADHPPVWGAHIWWYLSTKNVAAGAALLAPLAGWLGLREDSLLFEAVALSFLGITGVLLVHDLGRPERFLKILTSSNPRSWLVKGTWILMGFGLLCALSGLLVARGVQGAATLVRSANVPLAVLASGYSAFLFGQCRGRALWTEPGVFTHLVARAALLGTALGLILPATSRGSARCALAFAGLAAANAILVLVHARRERAGELELAVRLQDADGGLRKAALGFVQLAIVGLGVALVAPALPLVGLGLGAVAVAGSFFVTLRLERSWIRAGQALPIS